MPAMPDQQLERAIFARADSAITRRLDDETVIVPVRNNVADLISIYTLNGTGSFVWELLDGSRPLSEVWQRVSEDFEVDPLQAREDVLALISDLEGEGLIRMTPV
jgi:hypothetical protein